VEFITGNLSLGTLFGKFGRLLIEALEPLMAALREWGKAAGDKAGLGAQKAAEVAATALSIKQVTDCFERLRTGMLSVAGGGSVVNDIAQLRSLVASLNSANLAVHPRMMAVSSLKQDALGFGHGHGAKGELSAPGRGGPRPAGGEATGFLFRRIDPVRIARYVEQAQRFDQLASEFRSSEISAQRATLQHEIEQQEKDAAALAAAEVSDGGLGAEPGVVKVKLKKLGDDRVRSVEQFVRHVRTSVATYVTLHRRFMTQQHGEAARYMQYWRTIGKQSPAKDMQVSGWLEEHENTLKTLAKTARGRLGIKAREDVEAALQSVTKADNKVRLTESQMRAAGEQIDELAAWILRQSARVERLYQVGTQSLMDSVLDPELIAMYSFKGLRVLVAWIATSLASRAFQAMYRQRVYANDDPPPHPAVYVAMFLGLDAAAHLIFGVVLMAAKHLWGVDMALLRMWAFDWALVSVAVAVVSLVVAQVVYSKRYFRYKYEGERGIRAMQELVFCIYCVAVPLPFFRLTFG